MSEFGRPAAVLEDLDALVEARSRPGRVVVVGLDVAELDRAGPQPSRNAAAYAVGLARREAARLVGVWVRPPVTYAETFASTAATIAHGRKEAEDELRERAARAEQHFGLSGGAIVVRDGDPAVELLRVAAEVNADEIVVGASSERFGSVPAYVVRRAEVPVTVVP
jgi:nucleotide-binding universal stress UspA family protein